MQLVKIKGHAMQLAFSNAKFELHCVSSQCLRVISCARTGIGQLIGSSGPVSVPEAEEFTHDRESGEISRTI